MKNLLLFLSFLAFISACKSKKLVAESDTVVAGTGLKEFVESWIVGPEKQKCEDTTLGEVCYKIKKRGSLDYIEVKSDITGFDHEEGYKYQIEVKITPIKGGGEAYEMVRQVYKVKGK